MLDNRDMLSALDALLSIPSVSRPGGDSAAPFGPEAGRALSCALDLCAGLGFRTKNCGNMAGWAEIGQGEEMIAVLVHLDVVPAGEGWDVPPFACTLRDGRLYGRGVTDDKGPAVASIYAMKDLLDSSRPLRRRVRIIFGLAEEGGVWTDMDYYRRHEELPVFGFTPDADFPVIFGEKGSAVFRLSLPLSRCGLELLEGGQAENMVPDHCRAVVNGRAEEARGRAAHGSKPWEGENAIAALLERLDRLPVSQMYRRLLDPWGAGLGWEMEDARLGRLTVNVGKVRTLGDQAVFWLDVRCPRPGMGEALLDRLRERAAPFGASAELERWKDPVLLDPDGPLVSALMSAYREVTGDQESQPVAIGGSTYAKAMDHTAAFGPMLPGRPTSEHQKNESIALEDFLLLRRIYRAALERLAL